MILQHLGGLVVGVDLGEASQCVHSADVHSAGAANALPTAPPEEIPE